MTHCEACSLPLMPNELTCRACLFKRASADGCNISCPECQNNHFHFALTPQNVILVCTSFGCEWRMYVPRIGRIAAVEPLLSPSDPRT